MGFFDWIRKIFSSPRRRDVSRLDTGQEDLVEEIVELDGGPLKPHHRRMALRDHRLAPKSRSGIPGLTRPSRRAKCFAKNEAARLFSGTLRNRDRNLRDLRTDEAQLERLGLPIWTDEEDLAAALGISLNQLRFFSIHREKETAPHYYTFSIPKRSGGSRLIMAPKKRLKAIQRQLNDFLVTRLPVSDHAHGFRRGRSIRTGAEAHVGQRVVIRMDIKDFFPSIHFGRVRGLLAACGYGYPVATVLAVLMTEAERQPVEVNGQVFHVPVGSRYCVQGAPTSPGLANALVLRLDRRLAGLASGFGLSYTRYADDLAFSGEGSENLAHFMALVKRIVADEGFEIHPQKTRTMRKGRRQTVTGVVVNKDLGLSRQTRRRMRAAVHQLKNLTQDQVPDPERIRRLQGELAYLNMLNPKQAETLKMQAGDLFKGKPQK